MRYEVELEERDHWGHTLKVLVSSSCFLPVSPPCSSSGEQSPKLRVENGRKEQGIEMKYCNEPPHLASAKYTKHTDLINLLKIEW